MKIDFPKFTHRIDLGEYLPELKEQEVFVWVNPSSKLLSALSKDTPEGEKEENEFLLSLSELLSQGNKDTHFTVDELRELYDNTPPDFWGWFVNQIFTAINEYRESLKKN